MAYAAAITATTDWIDGRKHITLEVAETDAAAGDEWSYGDSVDEYIPRIFTITSYQSTLVSGTGTTIQPKMGNATGWTNDTQGEITRQSAAAAHINDQGLVRHTVPEGQRSAIFGESVVNDATADHVINTVITMVEGHLP